VTNYPYLIYTAALIVCGAISLLAALWAGRLNTARLPSWESLPRNRSVGVVITFLCLLWCVPQAKPIVWEWLLAWLYPLVLVFTVLSFFYLDYLFSRALGGFFILLTYYFVHEAFTFHTPLTALLAISCWVLGITGLFFSGKPHLMRDLIRKLARSARLRYITCFYFSFFGVLCLVLGLVHAFRS
jgi:hypothetical protein